MDRLHTHELRRLHHELESTLTPKQRQLMVVGALTPQMCTPDQIKILERMDPYLEGLTIEQAKQLAVIDVFAKGREAGKEAGQRQLKMMGVIFIIACIILGFFALIAP